MAKTAKAPAQPEANIEDGVPAEAVTLAAPAAIPTTDHVEAPVPTMSERDVLRAELHTQNENLLRMRSDHKAACEAFTRAEGRQYTLVRSLEKRLRLL